MGDGERRFHAERLAEGRCRFLVLELLEQGDARIIRPVGPLAARIQRLLPAATATRGGAEDNRQNDERTHQGVPRLIGIARTTPAPSLIVTS